MAWKAYRAEYWLKELHESMDRCKGRHDKTDITSKTALNTIQSINQSINEDSWTHALLRIPRSVGMHALWMSNRWTYRLAG